MFICLTLNDGNTLVFDREGVSPSEGQFPQPLCVIPPSGVQASWEMVPRHLGIFDRGAGFEQETLPPGISDEDLAKPLVVDGYRFLRYPDGTTRCPNHFAGLPFTHPGAIQNEKNARNSSSRFAVVVDPSDHDSLICRRSSTVREPTTASPNRFPNSATTWRYFLKDPYFRFRASQSASHRSHASRTVTVAALFPDSHSRTIR